MVDKWFISDTHFNHANMLTFNRDDGSPVRDGLVDVNHMNEYMIDKWNSVVKPQDYVYHLGDIGFDAVNLEKIFIRLNGKKRLVLGNHDTFDIAFYKRNFKKVMSWRRFGSSKEPAFICTHAPLHPDCLAGCLNVHGHIHYRVMDDNRYYNVSVENIDYIPVHYDSIIKLAKKVYEEQKEKS